ncbi:MAG TPA: hypothetical protein VHM70_32730 [Polyangiaceae bacterium]|nr:hypothetical protein [Polyangiaceae bacterium]
MAHSKRIITALIPSILPLSLSFHAANGWAQAAAPSDGANATTNPAAASSPVASSPAATEAAPMVEPAPGAAQSEPAPLPSTQPAAPPAAASTPASEPAAQPVMVEAQGAAGPVVDQPTPPKEPQIPVREKQRWSLLAELGWNSLVGFGPELAFHVDPHFTLEGAAGVGSAGWKAGGRARYNVLTGNLTPFIGAGFSHMGGGTNTQYRFDDDPDHNADPIEKGDVRVKASDYAQAVVGLDWIDRNGVNMVGTLGYSWLLEKNNAQYISGNPTAADERIVKNLYDGGLVISLAMGYSF